MKGFFLASTSPRRAEILRGLGVEFALLSPEVDENVPGTGAALVRRLAVKKALAAGFAVPEGLILAGDTMVFIEGRALGKPASREEAAGMLRLLSGRTHLVRSGLALLEKPEGRLVSGVSTTLVRFRELGEEEIAAYLATGEGRDKAGGYAVQGRGALLLARISGSYTNVVGLPVELLEDLLRRLGYSLWRWPA